MLSQSRRVIADAGKAKWKSEPYSPASDLLERRVPSAEHVCTMLLEQSSLVGVVAAPTSFPAGWHAAPRDTFVYCKLVFRSGDAAPVYLGTPSEISIHVIRRASSLVSQSDLALHNFPCLAIEMVESRMQWPVSMAATCAVLWHC